MWAENETQKEIEASEKLMELQLDTTRNKLLKADLCFSVINISVGVGAMIAGILGMNLHNGREESSEWWFIGTALGIVFGVFVVGACLGLIVMYQGLLRL